MRDLTVTHDDVVRLRPNEGLAVVLGEARVECDTLAGLIGEVLLPERAIGDAVRFDAKLPRAVLTVENLGAFVDLPSDPGLLVVHVPGWNTPLALRLLSALPEVPRYHFGDLDPDGLAILIHLRERSRMDVGWFIPDFWGDYLREYAFKSDVPWPGAPDPTCPPLVKQLWRSGERLEQEPIVVDVRMPRALRRLGRAAELPQWG